MFNEVLYWRKKVIEAVRKKTHPQQHLLSPSGLSDIARKRGIWVDTNALESWDKQGVFHPLLRVKYPFSRHYAKKENTWPNWEKEPLKDDIADVENIVNVLHPWSPNCEDAEDHIHPAVIDIPTVENFAPWSDYRQDGGTMGHIDIGGVYYHPYQIFRLKRVIEACQSKIHFISFTASEKIVDHINHNLKSSKTALQNSEVYELKVLYLLLCIEDRYLPSLRGPRHLMHLTSFGSRIEPNEWCEFERTFDPHSVFDAISFSVEEIKSMREDLARFRPKPIFV